MSLSKILGTRVVSILLAVAACVILDKALSSVIHDAYYIRLVMLAGIYVTLTVSLNLINGITGQFSIGHAGFYMVGAYAAGLSSNFLYDKQPLAMPAYLLISVLIGAGAAAIAGLIVGLPSLRLKGDYLAVVTLGFGEIIRIVTLNQEKWGGSYGYNLTHKYQSIAFVFLLAILCIAVCRNLLKSVHGLSFLAIREDEVAAQAMGINLTKTKVTAFVVGAAFAGAAGALFAHDSGFINPDLFKMEVSFLILTMVVLGGTGSITGSVIAAMTLFIIPEMGRIIKFEVSQGMLVALLLAVGAMVWSIRRTTNHFHGAKPQKSFRYLLSVVVPIGVGFGLGKVIETYTILGDKIYKANDLRFVILALVLLVVMLIRPTGLFGHHEFSWDWVKSKLNRRPVEAEA
ncbi:MAG: branched-chain amino acid ABC transporter permease [Fimbriimonadaceae bacterium]